MPPLLRISCVIAMLSIAPSCSLLSVIRTSDTTKKKLNSVHLQREDGRLRDFAVRATPRPDSPWLLDVEGTYAFTRSDRWLDDYSRTVSTTPLVSWGSNGSGRAVGEVEAASGAIAAVFGWIEYLAFDAATGYREERDAFGVVGYVGLGLLADAGLAYLVGSSPSERTDQVTEERRTMEQITERAQSAPWRIDLASTEGLAWRATSVVPVSSPTTIDLADLVTGDSRPPHGTFRISLRRESVEMATKTLALDAHQVAAIWDEVIRRRRRDGK